MAFIPAALAVVGGGSAIAGGVALAGAAVGIYSAIQTKKAGDLAAADLKVQAKTEEVAAKAREIDRRRNLIRALSSQNAAAGAAGVETSGSIEAIMRRDIKDAQNDLLTGNMNSQAKQRALRSQASNAQRVGTTNAVASLMDTTDKTYKALG